MAEPDIASLFHTLYDDISEASEFYNEKPLLAHYTSITALEAILRTDTVWFSNPLFMNDFQEVRFGVNESFELFMSNSEIEAAAGDATRYTALKNSFEYYFNEFANRHVIDTYVFSLSDHNADDNDGRLSMWRGYGSNGNGACIVIDSTKVPVVEGSPLDFAKVHYASAEARRNQINKYISQFCSVIESNSIPNEELGLCTYFLFDRIKLFALFTKHSGFKEEDEWRIVYLPERDSNGTLSSMIDYWIGPRGIEPKLKFKVDHIAGITSEGLSLSNMIDRIILGPTISSPLAKAMTEKMLDKIGKQELKEKLMASTIPFRQSI
jgi:Protein of unknown function (DUF2971)